MKFGDEFVDLVIDAACVRDEDPIERKWVEAALESIKKGAKVERYPLGSPSLKGVYDLAVQLAAQ